MGRGKRSKIYWNTSLLPETTRAKTLFINFYRNEDEETPMDTIAETLHKARTVLAESGITARGRDSSALLALALKKDPIFLIAHPEYILTPQEKVLFGEYITRRADREPMQYIRGSQEFYRLEFEVTADVLIPRPETEHLVEAAIDLLKDGLHPRICDVGTGSGCILVSILYETPNASGIAVDISPEALKVAVRNAERHGVADRLEFRESDLFSALNNEKFDIIVSNPPYVHSGDIEILQPEVRDFEPTLALTDGADGFSIIERIVREAPEFLNPGGFMLMEIGSGQHERVLEMFDPQIWQAVELIPDLQSIPRVVNARMT